jgi:phospholipase/carboxylesterase
VSTGRFGPPVGATTGPFDPPVVVSAGPVPPAAPLVVLLHGRGSDERQILELAAHLPAGPGYVAVRGPITLDTGGSAWFANRGIGRPVEESLRATMDWFRAWLDSVAPAGRPVVLVGFSGGACFAGGLVLDDPTRYAGVAVLHGNLPFDAGVPVAPQRLSGVPVLVTQGERDQMIPRDLSAASWAYLHDESGAVVTAYRDPGEHEISATTLATLRTWLTGVLPARP